MKKIFICYIFIKGSKRPLILFLDRILQRNKYTRKLCRSPYIRGTSSCTTKLGSSTFSLLNIDHGKKNKAKAAPQNTNG